MSSRPVRSNANRHPGQIVLAAQQTRRSTAEMAEHRAQQSAEAEAARSKLENLCRRIQELEAMQQEQAGHDIAQSGQPLNKARLTRSGARSSLATASSSNTTPTIAQPSLPTPIANENLTSQAPGPPTPTVAKKQRASQGRSQGGVSATSTPAQVATPSSSKKRKASSDEDSGEGLPVNSSR